VYIRESKVMDNTEMGTRETNSKESKPEGTMRILVIYHSQQKGNTRRMADLVAEGCRQVKGVSVALVNVNETRVNMDDMESADGYALGSPNYYSYMAGGLKQFFDDLRFTSRAKKEMRGKPYVAFITYGVGGGIRSRLTRGGSWSALRSVKRLAGHYELIMVGKSVICQGAPSEQAARKAIELGRSLAQHLTMKTG
jgi:multimeric flavodoxin WrbA